MKLGPIVSPKSREYFEYSMEKSMHNLLEKNSDYSLKMGKKVPSAYSSDRHSGDSIQDADF